MEPTGDSVYLTCIFAVLTESGVGELEDAIGQSYIRQLETR